MCAGSNENKNLWFDELSMKEAEKAAWEALPKEEQRRLSEELWEGFFEATQYLT